MAVDLPPLTWHYERSDADGSEREQVYVHRAAPGRLAVYKMRERCTGAALVMADIDPATGEARRLVAGRLLPGGGQQPIGELALDPAGLRLTMTLTMDGKTTRQSVPVGTRPWHLYDYDLATLTVATQQRRRPRAGFRFGLALVWPETPDRMLRWLGDVRTTFVRAERHRGRPAYRFAVAGTAFGAKGGGPLWLDAADGKILEAAWGLPNHAGYRAFRLRLIGDFKGAAAWRQLLERHYAGCPVDGQISARPRRRARGPQGGAAP